jgi:hypothetical protein
VGEPRVPRPYVGAAAAAPRGVEGGQYVACPPGPSGADGGDPGIVVFLVGMRVNRWRRVRSWWPAFIGMPRMLAELERHPEAGLLGARTYWSGRTFLSVQYWRSPQHLGAYAREPSLAHRPAWAAFNKRTASRGDVGVFHETYVVPAANIESLYGNMPRHGLAAAVGAAPRGSHRRSTAQDRMGQQEPDYVAAD